MFTEKDIVRVYRITDSLANRGIASTGVNIMDDFLFVLTVLCLFSSDT